MHRRLPPPDDELLVEFSGQARCANYVAAAFRERCGVDTAPKRVYDWVESNGDYVRAQRSALPTALTGDHVRANNLLTVGCTWDADVELLCPDSLQRGAADTCLSAQHVPALRWLRKASALWGKDVTQDARTAYVDQRLAQIAGVLLAAAASI